MEQAQQITQGALALAVLFGLVALYFLPWIVAARRNRAVAPVALINLFLGWTFIGWFLALVWASTERSAREEAMWQADRRPS
jgi:hypothetical protein